MHLLEGAHLPEGRESGEGRRMGFWAFQKLCLSRAWTDLRSYAGEHIKAAIFALIASSPALPLAAHLGSNMTQEVWAIVIQSFIGPALLIGLGFLWFWTRAPFALWREATANAAPTAATPDGPEPFRARRASYALWDMIDPLELYQVACLWIDLAPPDSAEVELVGDASASLYALQRAVEQGQLVPTNEHLTDLQRTMMRFSQSVTHGAPAPAEKTTRFTREALKGYARELGLKPRFLFPEARANSWMA